MKYRITKKFTIGLTDFELARLKAMLDAHDRGGFYLAYHAMTGSKEALLTSKITTFSEPTGGIAYVANWSLQQQFGDDPQKPYTSIYALSQLVAEEAFKAIKVDAEGKPYVVKSGPPLQPDEAADGVVSDQRLFNSSFNGWDEFYDKYKFPGNLLIYLEQTVSAANALGGGQAVLENPTALPLQQALESDGFKAAAKAIYFALQFGKQEDDFENTIDGPNGIKLAVDSKGRVEGVFDGTDTADFLAIIAPVHTKFIVAAEALLADASPGDDVAALALGLVGQAAFVATEVAGLAAFGVTAWPKVREAWVDAYLHQDKTKAGLLGMSDYKSATESEVADFLANVDESQVRSNLSQFNSGFNGDRNSPGSPGDPTLTWKAAATEGDDVLSLNTSGQLDGQAGDDLLFGSEQTDTIVPSGGIDTLIGGAGDDVIWGRSGVDTIYGDDLAGEFAGNDTIRGGKGDDIIFGGRGNDFIDGGDVTVSRLDQDYVGTIAVFSEGHNDKIDYTKLKDQDGHVSVAVSVRIEEDIANHFEGELSNLGGVSGVVQKGSSGGLGTDVFHSIERFELGAADNVIRHGTSSKEENRSDGGIGHTFNFNLKDATEGFTQRVFVVRDGDENVSDAVLRVDGNQLVGGAAFDFNKFEMRTGDFGTFSPFFSDREYGPLDTLDRYLAARGASIASLFGQASGLAGTNLGTPGLGAAGIGTSLGLFFGFLGISEAMRWDQEWLSAYEQITLGWHGERYILSEGPADQPRRLTIILDTDDTQALQQIVIENWKQGDFGIRIEEFEWQQGLETGTNKNGIFDQWSDFTDAEIQAQLRALGFYAPPDRDASLGGGSGSPEPGTARQGDSSANFLGASDGDDVLRGAEGDDDLIGQEGFDTYVFSVGDGHDVIYDTSAEGGRIQFTDGVDVAVVTQVEVDDGNGGTNLLITYGDGDTITIVGWSSLAQDTKDAWIIEGLDGPVVSSSDPALTPDTSVRPTEHIGTSGDDQIDGSDDAGILEGRAGNDVLRGNGGDDQILGGSGSDTVSGGDGHDRIVAGDDDDIIRGGRGNDDIDGGRGDDTYYFDLGDGADTIRDDDGSVFLLRPTDTNRIVFGEGISAEDIRIERDPDATDALILNIGTNGDRIRIVDQYDWAYIGFDGIEEFAFHDGTFWTREDLEELYLKTASTDGDDKIVGFEHLDDVIDGGAGNDTLVGSFGSDTYLWNRGDGNDLIIDATETFPPDGDVDVLRFGSGIAVADVAVSRPAGSYDLVLTVSGADGGQITVVDFLRAWSDSPDIDFVQFHDGTTWDKQGLYDLSLAGVASDGDDVIQGTPGIDVIDGGLGDDNITGSSGDDTLIGGAGNDFLQGDTGSDTYIFGASFGQDEIDDEASSTGDRIVFTDGIAADFTFRLSSSDERHLIIEHVDSEGSLLVNNYENSYGRIETYEFADGVKITWEEVEDIAEISMFAPNPTTGTLDADVLTGTDLGDRLFGLSGDDQLVMGAGNDIGYGGAGADRIDGGAGRDVLFGSYGNDVLDAGDGDDMVYGGTGQDTLLGGAGNDVLDGGLQEDMLDGGAGDDELKGGAGDDDLSGGAGDDELEGGTGNDDLSGGAGDDELKGGAGNDELTGGAGNDVLVGGAGDDTYRFARGDGQDVIRFQDGHEDGDVKTLVLGEGLTQDNIRFTIDSLYGGSLRLLITFANGTTDNIKVEHFAKNGVLDRIVFADGSEMSAQEILERAVGATAGDDDPAPSSGDEYRQLVYGGRGNDVLNETNGTTYFGFARGDGDDTIHAEGSTLYIWDYAPEDVILARTGSDQNDLTLSFVGSDDRVTIANHFDHAGLYGSVGIGEIVFQNGTAWDREALSNLVLKFAASDGDDNLVGGSDTPWVDWDERFEGGLGDDDLSGGIGADTYVYALGDGSHTVNDTYDLGNDVDRLELGSGLTPANVLVGRSQSDPNDVVFTMPDGGQIVLVDQLAGDARGVERVDFLDGTSWTREELASRVANSSATGGDDVIDGSATAETIIGGLGDDTLTGGDGGDIYSYSLGDGSDQIIEGATEGKDRLRFDGSILPEDVTLGRDPANPDNLRVRLGDGNVITVANHFIDGMGLEFIEFADGLKWDRSAMQAKALEGSSSQGDDILIGTSNDDTVFGAEGNDTLDGGAGSDLYVFRIGDGQDVLQDSGGQEGADRLVLGDDIDQEMVGLSRDGDNLTLSLGDTADSVTVVDYFVPGKASIGTIEFQDGTVWDAAEITARGNNQAPVVGAGIAQQTVAQNADFLFSIPGDAFSDPDPGDTLTYTASLTDGSALPDWLTFDGQQFSGVPTNDDVESISVRVTAIDGSGNRQTTDFVLEVTNTNDAPVAGDVLPNQAASIGVAFAYTVPETLFSDPDAIILGPSQPDLTYSAELEDGSPLPSWLSFDPATRTFNGTPAAGSDGALSVRVIASDGQASGSALLSIAVGGGNTAPNVLTPIAAQQADEDATFVFVIPDDAFSDATPGDRLTYSAKLEDGSALPDWLSFDARTGTLQGIPSNDDVGSLSIKVTATDAYNETATSVFVLNVADVNDAPTGPGTLDSHVVREQSLFDHTISQDAFEDIDLGDSLSLTAEQSDGRPLPSWLTFENGRFTGTPDDEDVSLHHIVVTAMDSAGATVSADFYMFVEPVNDAPEVVAPLPQITVDQFEDFTFELPETTFRDADDLGLSFSASSADGSELPSWLTFDPTTRTFSGDPSWNSVGTYEGSRTHQFKVTATDPSGASVDAPFVIVVQGEFPGEIVNGTSGDDVVNGTDGPDTITGGAGNDELVGKRGADTFVFGPGFGQDRIDDYSSYGGNRIVFEAGIAPEDVSLSRAGHTIVFQDADYYLSDLVIDIAGSSDQITVDGQFSSLIDGLPAISEIEFANGTIWDADYITSQFLVPTAGDDILPGDAYDNVIHGEAGSDELFGLFGNDVLNGGAGDDILYGAGGDDTYIFEIGTGSDLIVDEEFAYPYSFDTLRFGDGITPGDLVFTRDFNDPRIPGEQSFRVKDNLRIEYAPTGDNVIILYQYNFDYDRTGGIERFEFADGTVFNVEEFDRLVSPDGLLFGTEGDDDLQGTSLDETIVGLGGDDILDGGLGDDTYRWSRGDGNDSIQEYSIWSFDVLEFGAGIRPDDVIISRPTYIEHGGQLEDLYFDILPTGERITVESGVHIDIFDTWEFAKPIDEVRFEDGTVWSFSYIANTFLEGTSGNDILIGFDPSNDTLDGGAGNDELRGRSGSDTYVFGLGYGTDTIFDGRGSYNIHYPRDARDFIHFDEGILPSDIEITRNLELGADGELLAFTNLAIANTQDTLRLTGEADYILELFFQETGATWTLDELQDVYLAQNSTDGDDVLIGFGHARTLNAGAGNDKLIAHYDDSRSLSDVLIGGEGNDTYEVGDNARFVSIEDQGLAGDTDVLYFNQDFLSSWSSPDDVSFRQASNGHDLHVLYSYTPTVVLRNFFAGPESTIEEIRFSDGTVLTVADILARTVANTVDANVITGTAEAETITGVSSLGETIDGGAGDDTLIGGSGASDVYLWRTGDGNDVIVDGSGYAGLAGGIIKFGDVNASDVSILKSSEDLQIRVNTTGEILTIEDHFGTTTNDQYAVVEAIMFANGEIWRHDVIESQAVIEGTAANDTLIGSDDDDRFLGGPGNDVINSVDGDDTFIYRAGDGSDTINETGEIRYRLEFTDLTITRETRDRLEFTDLDASDVELSRVGEDLSIAILATNDTISVTDQFDRGYYGYRPLGIEEIVFADGTIWDKAKITEEAWIRGTIGDDTLIGSYDEDDTLQGRGGNDLLVGRSGSDTYKFSLGDGLDTISEQTNDTDPHIDAVEFGSGITPTDIVLTRENNGSDLAITISGTTDKIVVSDHFATATSGIEEVVFADGTVWSRDQLVQLLNPATSGDDTLIGDESDNVINGEAGNDTITGLGGEDSITGGPGDDILAGGADSDTYFFSRGDGNDIINDAGPDGEIVDRLIFAADILPSDISVERSADGEDFILRVIDTGETITLQDRLISATGGVDEVVFSDGTHWDFVSLERLSSTNQAPVATDDSATTDAGVAVAIDVLSNDSDPDVDTLSVMNASDGANGQVGINPDGTLTYTPNAGFDGTDSFTYTVSDGRGGTDSASVTVTVNAPDPTPVVVEARIASGLADSEEAASGVILIDSSDLELVDDAIFNGDDQTVGLRFTGLDIPAGAVITAAYLQFQADETDSGAINLTIRAEASDNAGAFSTVDNDLSGRATTSASVTWSPEAWVSVGDAGDAQRTPDLSALVQEVIDRPGWAADNALAVLITGTGERTAESYEGDPAAAPLLHVEYIINAIEGTTGDDTLAGTSADDVLIGGLGNDTLTGMGGDDVYRYASGEGSDVIYEGTSLGVDQLVFSDLNIGDLTFARVLSDTNDLAITVNATGDVITVDGQFSPTAQEGLEGIEFADGTVWGTATIEVNAWFRGTSGNDTISGTSGDDVIYGDAGDDTLGGSSGDDTFVFRAGFGQDVINAFAAGAATNDVIELDGLSATNFAEVAAAATQVGADTSIDLGADGTITLAGVNLADLHQDDFRFV